MRISFHFTGIQPSPTCRFDSPFCFPTLSSLFSCKLRPDQVVDYYNYDREIAAISLNFLDRYVAKRPLDKVTFQLAALTCLYLACKLHAPHSLCMASLTELSRGYFTEEDVVAMEESILR